MDFAFVVPLYYAWFVARRSKDSQRVGAKKLAKKREKERERGRKEYRCPDIGTNYYLVPAGTPVPSRHEKSRHRSSSNTTTILRTFLPSYLSLSLSLAPRLLRVIYNRQPFYDATPTTDAPFEIVSRRFARVRVFYARLQQSLQVHNACL